MPQLKLVDAETFKRSTTGTDDLALFKTWLPTVDILSESEAKESGAEKSDRTMRFTISTEEVDRDSDTISVSGWQLGNFKKNPMVLWAHSYDQPPIARALKTWKGDGALVSVAEFQDADLNPFADMVYRMYKGGWMRAVSVGFIPTEWTQSKDPSRPSGYDFTRQELLEFSAVPIPSAPAALMDAHKAGVNTAPLKAWAEKVLDLKQPLHGLTRTEIEQAWEVIGSKAIIIDLGSVEKDPFTPLPDPIAPPPEPIVDPPPIIPPLDLKVGSCPECSEPITLALPVDGAEMQHRCACGATWTVKSVETLDVSDYRDDVIELAEEPALDFSPEAIEGAVARMAADIRSKLSL